MGLITCNEIFPAVSPLKLRLKSAAFLVSAPLTMSGIALTNATFKLMKISLGAPFWLPENRSTPITFKVRLLVADLLKVAFTPLFLIAMEVTALAGIFFPIKGRHMLYHEQKLLFGKTVITPWANPIEIAPKSRPLSLRNQCFRLSILTVIFDVPYSVFFTLKKVVKVATMNHIWYNHPKVSLTSRIGEWMQDIVLLPMAPVFLVAMEVSLVYGMILGNKEGKNFAFAIERILLGKAFLGSFESLKN